MAGIKNHYKTLGVADDATADVIKKAYRKLARQYHPDRNPDKNAEERFKEVQAAYETLSDPAKRREYDAMRRNPFAGGEDTYTTTSGNRFYRSSDGSYVRYGGPGEGRGGLEDLFGGEGSSSGFGDFFSRIFGAGTPPEAPGPEYNTGRSARNAAQTVVVHLTFEQALRGGRTEVSLPSGEAVRVNVPRGVRPGLKIRLKQKTGGKDVYVRFEVQPNPQFTREKNDLLCTIQVGVFEALLGTARTITTAYGTRIKVTVPAGTQNGEKLRLKGQGVQTESETGDLYAQIQLIVPTNLTDEQKDILRKAARQAGLI